MKSCRFSLLFLLFVSFTSVSVSSDFKLELVNSENNLNKQIEGSSALVTQFYRPESRSACIESQESKVSYTIPLRYASYENSPTTNSQKNSAFTHLSLHAIQQARKNKRDGKLTHFPFLNMEGWVAQYQQEQKQKERERDFVDRDFVDNIKNLSDADSQLLLNYLTKKLKRIK